MKQIISDLWRMWSRAHSSTHDSGVRGHGFDPKPKPRTTSFGSSHLPSIRQQT